MMLFNILALLPLLPAVLCAEKWETLPPTPSLPVPINTIRQSVNGIELWYQQYNPTAGNPPLVFLHGGLGYSAYFGDVITHLSQTHYVIAIDRRGHGRSSYASSDVFTFSQFAQDTSALLLSLGVREAIWIGWSDGAATTIAGLLDEGISPGISKAFVFAGFQSWRDTNTTFTEMAIYQEFVSRCANEYAELQPEANFTDFATKVGTLEATLPTWSDAELARIEGSKVMIVGAEYDEAVNLAVAPHLSEVIVGSELRILKDVSHFAPVQDPVQFAEAIEEFLGE